MPCCRMSLAISREVIVSDKKSLNFSRRRYTHVELETDA
jgi:hypothetical protein